jgi:hypothetical protein
MNVSYKTYQQFEGEIAIVPNFPMHMPIMMQPYQTGDEDLGFLVATQEEFDALMAECEPLAAIATTAAFINAKITNYQQVSPQLLRELYVENTMAGITNAQSDQMFDDYQDIITRLKEGAFPTALYRLTTKSPSGFVTQALIDRWKTKIEGYL